jgi:tetratricopeptide (TPR) repeat protein
VRTFTRNKDWKDDFTLFKNDVKHSPGSARTHFNNALVFEKTTANDLTKAQKEYEVCLGIDPYYHDAILNLGTIYMKQANYAPAISLYHTDLSKYKDNPDALGNMGYTFYKMGQRDSAVYYLKKAELTGSINAVSCNVLGTLYFEKKDYPGAISVYEKGLKKDSSNAEMYNNYGNVLALTNRYEAALKAFQSSYRLNNNKQALYFMAITYNKLGDTVNAYKYYNEFKKLNP